MIRRLTSPTDKEIEALADVLIDCVEGGSSVSFMAPLTRERAIAYWRTLAESVAANERALLAAEDANGICGTVQIIFAEPENQPHRADIAKMLVHRRARRKGIGAALMKAAEATALECGKTLLVLDTADATAERLYERSGWIRVGAIPNYALMPNGDPCTTVVFYRDLLAKPSKTPRVENIRPILRVADMNRSVKYYADVLGFTPAPWGDEWFTAMTRDRCDIFLCKGSQGNPGTWVWVGMEDVELLYNEYKRSGANIRVPPRNYPWALEMHVEDPDGHIIRFGSEPKADRPFDKFIE